MIYFLFFILFRAKSCFETERGWAQSNSTSFKVCVTLLLLCSSASPVLVFRFSVMIWDLNLCSTYFEWKTLFQGIKNFVLPYWCVFCAHFTPFTSNCCTSVFNKTRSCFRNVAGLPQFLESRLQFILKSEGCHGWYASTYNGSWPIGLRKSLQQNHTHGKGRQKDLTVLKLEALYSHLSH